LPNEKIIGQVHKVYHIHLDGGKFRQTARHETGIGLGSVVEPRFVCQARLPFEKPFDKITPYVHCRRAKNLGDAESYFDEHLSQNDYYAAGEIRPGQWIGAGAERLGLKGKVTREQFHALCENQNPE
jgi:hypothetical protein